MTNNGFHYEILIHVYKKFWLYLPSRLLTSLFYAIPLLIFMFWFGKVIHILVLNDPVCFIRVAYSQQ